MRESTRPPEVRRRSSHGNRVALFLALGNWWYLQLFWSMLMSIFFFWLFITSVAAYLSGIPRAQFFFLNTEIRGQGKRPQEPLLEPLTLWSCIRARALKNCASGALLARARVSFAKNTHIVVVFQPFDKMAFFISAYFQHYENTIFCFEVSL